MLILGEIWGETFDIHFHIRQTLSHSELLSPPETINRVPWRAEKPTQYGINIKERTGRNSNTHRVNTSKLKHKNESQRTSWLSYFIQLYIEGFIPTVCSPLLPLRLSNMNVV